MSDSDTGGVDWEAVYWEQTPRLFNFFRYRTGRTDAAQELTSRTMLRAWRYRHSYQADLGAFEAWLFQIARRVAFDYLRECQQAPLPLYDEGHYPATDNIEAQVSQQQQAQQLYRLLAELPTRDQEIISLKYGADMTNREIARTLDMSASNIGTILHRTLKKLRLQWRLTYETPPRQNV